MADKYKQIAKEFLLSDSSVNCYGYRLLTSGYLMSEFAKNPIGYYNHEREQGVLVKWENLRIEGDKVYGTPTINLNHPRGQKTVDEIENGFLNGASFGHINAIEISTNPDDYLPEQKGPSVSKYYNRECSLVDIPGNFNALTELFDKDDNPLNLSAVTPNFLTMKQIFLTPANLALLNLKADSEQSAIDTALADLVAKAGKVDTLQSQLSAVTTEKNQAVKDLADFKTAANQTQVKDLLATALNTDKKITKELSDKLEKQFAGKPDELKDLLAAMPAYQSVTESLKGNNGADDLANQTWEVLDKSGKLADLKAKNFDAFKKKYETKFGKPYVEAK